MQLTKHTKLTVMFSIIGCGILICYSLFSVLGRGNISSTDSKPSTGLVCERNVYNFGNVLPTEATKCEYSFILKNNSMHRIKIIRHSSSCGCTAIKVPKDAILPGQTAEVLVRANFGQKLGKRRTVVTLETDDQETPKLILKMHALVDAPVVLSPDVLYFGSLQPREQKTRIVKLIKRTDQQKVRLLGITNPSPNLSISRLSRRNSKAINTSVEGEAEEFAVTITGTNAKGEETAAIIFHTNMKKFPELTLSVMAQHEGTMKAVPSMLIFHSGNDVGNDMKEIRITMKQSNVEPEIELVQQPTSSNLFHIEQTKTIIEFGRLVIIVSVRLNLGESNKRICRGILRVKCGSHKLDVPIVVFGQREEEEGGK